MSRLRQWWDNRDPDLVLILLVEAAVVLPALLAVYGGMGR